MFDWPHDKHSKPAVAALNTQASAWLHASCHGMHCHHGFISLAAGLYVTPAKSIPAHTQSQNDVKLSFTHSVRVLIV